MKLRSPTSYAALLVALASVTPAFAAYQGVKSSVTLGLTATSEIGGYLVKDSALAGEEAKGITYDEDSIQNPPGFNPESAKANYYSEKRTVKTKDYDPSTEGENIHPTSIVHEESGKLHPQKMTNADFIKALVARGYVPDSALTGHRLVAIFPADRPTSDETPPALFFIENLAGTSIHYVGREPRSFGETENGYSPTVHDALLLDFGSGVEAYSYKSAWTFDHRRVPDGEGGTTWEFDDVGQEKLTDTFSGKVRAYVDIFPEVYDANTENYTSTGTTYYFSGLLSFSGSLKTFNDQDPSNDIYVTNSAKLLAENTSGSFYGDYDADFDYYRSYGITTGGVSMTNTKVVSDITPYLDAIPEALDWLKKAIVDSYSPTSIE